MEVLALQLSELLEISIEKAIELYPVLRTQFIFYKIGGLIANFSFITFLVLSIWAMFVSMDSWWDERKSKKGLILLGLSVALIIISESIRYIFATDLMIMLEFL